MNNKGIAYALAACFIWGLIFVVPQFMPGFSAIEVALGRFFFYGLISSLIFFKAFLQRSCRYPLPIWIKALYLSIIPSFGYYIFFVLSLRYASPAISALILGIAPITIALLGNWKEKECSYKSLILPSILILIGLAAINVPQLLHSASPSTYLIGLVCALLALAAWTWYVVMNSRFLKRHPEVRFGDWSTLIGVATLFWVAVFALLLILFFQDQFHLQNYTKFESPLIQFLVGSAICGLLCSWVGAFLWNKASFYLPVSLTGQLMIFETIFGLIFVYILDQNFPPLLECLGIVFFLAAVVYGIRQSAKTTAQQPASH